MIWAKPPKGRERMGIWREKTGRAQKVSSSWKLSKKHRPLLFGQPDWFPEKIIFSILHGFDYLPKWNEIQLIQYLEGNFHYQLQPLPTANKTRAHDLELRILSKSGFINSVKRYVPKWGIITQQSADPKICTDTELQDRPPPVALQLNASSLPVGTHPPIALIASGRLLFAPLLSSASPLKCPFYGNDGAIAASEVKSDSFHARHGAVAGRAEEVRGSLNRGNDCAPSA